MNKTYLFVSALIYLSSVVYATAAVVSNTEVCTYALTQAQNFRSGTENFFSGFFAPENCTNGIDDDGDGLVDCNDPDCKPAVGFSVQDCSVADADIHLNVTGSALPYSYLWSDMINEARWTFNNTTNDASGNNHHLGSGWVGTLSYDAADKVEGTHSFSFNGATFLRYSVDGGFLETAYSQRTYAFWIKPANLSGIKILFEQGGSTAGLAIRLNNNLLQAAYRVSSVQYMTGNLTFPADGAWHHVAAVFNNGTLTLYLDGVAGIPATSLNTSIPANGNNDGVGGRNNSDAFASAAANYYSGKMDDFRIVYAALSAKQVADLARNNGVRLDAPAGNYTVTVSGSTGCTATRSIIVNVPCREICNNLADDDGDGLIDTDDSDCPPVTTKVIPAGSFIIDMGVVPQTIGNALKPYGLVWQLLHNFEIPVLWSIDPYKLKDGADFWYNGKAYRGGPFIVSVEYRTPQVNALIQNWQAQGVVGVTTTSEVTVPVGVILNYSMNWTINLTNASIVKAYLDRAGIPETAYNYTLPQNLNCCHDVFLMPHSEPTWNGHSRLFTWNASPAQGGCKGTIWAGCKAGSEVENIVNPANPSQRMNFLMLDPVPPATSPAVWSNNHQDGTFPPPYIYDHHGHPVMQFLGTMDGAQENGAEQIFLPTRSWRPTTYIGIWDDSHPNVPSLSPGKAAKLAFGLAFGDSSRGYVMYQAGHRLDKDSKAENIAAQRAFLNFSFLAVGEKAIKATANIPEEMEGGTTYTLTAEATGGSGNYLFRWETSCGGTFSNPFAATTNFTTPNNLTYSECFIKVTVTDDCGSRMGFQNVYLRLQPRPLPPVALDDYATTLPGTPVTINALANDSDPNLDPLTLTGFLDPANTGNGIFVNNNNGTVTYTPNFNYVGSDQIRYRLCDNTPPGKGGPLCDTAIIYVTINWSAPNGCFPDEFFTQTKQGYATSVLAQNAISNPTQALGAPTLMAGSSSYYALIDNNSDYLVLNLGNSVEIGDTILIYMGTDDGTLSTLQVRGSLTSTSYSTGAGFYDLRSYTTNTTLNSSTPKQDTVLYIPTTGSVSRLRFTRAAGAGKPAVNGVEYRAWRCLSKRPTANDDAVSLCEDNVVTFNVLTNDSDPRGLSLSVDSIGLPVNGTALLLTNGDVRYKPNNDFSGMDSFVYKVCNTAGFCSVAKVRLTIVDDACPVGYYKINLSGSCSGSCILSPNNPPAAVNDYAATVVNTPVTVPVQNNDSDPSGFGLTTSLNTAIPPRNGSAVVNGIQVSYTPAADFTGLDTFGYRVCNPYGCANALVIVRVHCADPGSGNAIAGLVFEDANRNAVYENGEAGVTNVKLYLYDDADSSGTHTTGDVLLDSVLTNGQGKYAFNVSAPGSGGSTGGGITTNAHLGTTVYSTGTNTLSYRSWNNGFSSQTAFPVSQGARAITLVGAEAPTRDEKIIVGSFGSSYSGTTTRALMWNGTTWADVPFNPLATGIADGRTYGFASAYEQLSGNAMLVWTDGTNLKFAIKNGTTWSAPATVSAYAGGAPSAMRLAAKPGSNEMVLMVAEFNGIHGLVWNGTSWGNFQTFYPAFAFEESMGVAYESLSGRAMVFYGGGNNFTETDGYYRFWNGTSWSSQYTVTKPGAVTHMVHWTHLASDPKSNRIGMIAHHAAGHIWGAIWDGTDWQAKTYFGSDNMHYGQNTHIAAETNSGDFLAIYKSGNYGAWSYRTWNATLGWSAALTGPTIPVTALGGMSGMILRPNAESDQIVAMFHDFDQDINAVVWNGSAWGSVTELTTNTGAQSAELNGACQPYEFLWNSGYTPFYHYSIDLLSSKDNQITANSTTFNYGASQTLDSYNSGGIVRRSLFKFDLSDIPFNATIVSASMELYAYSIATANTPVKAHRLTADWTEGTANAAAGVANWTQRLASPATNWGTAGGDFAPTPASSIITNGTTAGTYSFDLTQLTQQWVNGTHPNHGVILLNDAGFAGVSWRSKEWTTASQRPRLSVKFTVNGNNGYYIIRVNPASLPPNSTLTSDNLQTAVLLSIGESDCANNFGVSRHLPPVANPDTAYVDAGTSAVINVIANDSDPEGTPLSMTILTDPLQGTALNNQNGTLTYTPFSGFTGWETFTYYICDQGTPSLCDTSTVTVIVSVLVNDPPVAQDDYDTTTVNHAIETDVLHNDFDQEFGVLTVSLSPGIQQPANGTVTVLKGTLVEYTPNPGFTGNDVYQYIVCDDATPSLCDTARVFIHVRNQPPDARPDMAETQIGFPVTIPVLDNDIEPDGHSIILLSAGSNAGASNGQTLKGGTVSVNNNGTPAIYSDDKIVYTPQPAFSGLDTFYYRVRDSGTPNFYDTTFVVVKITPLIDLELTKTVAPDTTIIGQNVTFTLTLANKGSGTATQVLVIDRLPDSYQLLNNNGAGSFDPISRVWYVPSLLPNQTRTLQITAKILNAANLKNVTEVIAADQRDIDSTPNNDDGDQSEDDEDSATPYLREICTNGADDDGDGLADCADPDCSLGLGVNLGADAGICPGQSIALNASTVGGALPYTYNWSGGLGSGPSKTVAPLTTTTFAVTVTSANGCTATDDIVVAVNPLPSANAGPNVTICSGTSTTLTATGGVSYQWSNGLGAGDTKTVSPASTTTYTVTVTSAAGCTNFAQVTVTVNTSPAANAGGDVTICEGASTTLTATGNGTYTWSHGLGAGATHTVTPPITTTYTVTVTAANGCTATDDVTVNVNLPPAANAGPDVIICNGTSTTLTASGGTGYIWDNGLGAGAVKTVSPSATTTYRVTVTAANGCTATAQVTVTVNNCVEDCSNGTDDDGDGLIDCADPDCSVDVFAGTDLNICTGASATINAEGTGGSEPYAFNWSHGLGAGQSKTVTPASTTLYTVTITSANGCTDTDQVRVEVISCPEICTDGIDNDQDGLLDCDDPDCRTTGAPALNDDSFQSCPGSTFSESVIFNDANLQHSVFSILTNPTHGSVSINSQGRFVYTPNSNLCGGDSFQYQVCNSVTGCCDAAMVNLTIGDTEPPQLLNLPTDLAISCDDEIPAPPVVFAIDACPGIFVNLQETATDYVGGACENYTVIRTWTATDLCGNSISGSQNIQVSDQTPPEIFQVYTLNNGKRLLAGVAKRGTHLWKHVAFPIAFSEPPVILTQVVSAQESAAVTVRQRNVNTDGFDLRLQEEENSNELHLPESIAWIAIEPGALSGALSAGIWSNANHTLKPFGFSQTFTAPPLLFTAIRSTVDKDPVSPRHVAVTISGASVYLQEETSKDAETTHGNESLNYLAVAPGAPIRDANSRTFGETGTVTLNHLWTTVTLSRRYLKPVVIMGSLPSSDASPATLRVRNVSGNSFQVRIEEWDYLDGIHQPENVAYIVVEGSIAAESDHYCSSNSGGLTQGVNLFVFDNCDAQAQMLYHENSNISATGMLVDRIWSATDDCDNTEEIVRQDTCLIASVKIKAMLFGAALGNQGVGLMRDDLRAFNLVPTKEPYSTLAGYQHKGLGGNENLAQTMMSLSGEDAVVDWLFIEIRDGGNDKIVVATQSALLLRNGKVVSVDGEEALYFPSLVEGDYYVSVKHRNHLGMMTDQVWYLSSDNPPLIDFTLPTMPVRGGMSAGRIIDGRRAMWPGDLNGDGRAIYQGPNNDVFSLFSFVMADDLNNGFLANFVSKGYDRNDLNLDGKIIYQGPNNERAMILYHSVLVHPANVLFLANYIVKASLP